MFVLYVLYKYEEHNSVFVKFLSALPMPYFNIFGFSVMLVHGKQCSSNIRRAIKISQYKSFFVLSSATIRT